MMIIIPSGADKGGYGESVRIAKFGKDKCLRRNPVLALALLSVRLEPQQKHYYDYYHYYYYYYYYHFNYYYYYDYYFYYYYYYYYYYHY